MWYVGDPCYLVDDDERWNNFCNLTFARESLAKAKEMYGGDRHVDSVINFEGQEITLWSNGGDGIWTFNGLNSANRATAFGVDAGIFCVIDLDNFKCDADPALNGILFHDKPDLYVENGIVYINGQHDNSVMTCEGWRCGRIISESEVMSCQNGNCEEGCDSCFECTCCDDCGESEDYCSCGEEE